MVAFIRQLAAARLQFAEVRFRAAQVALRNCEVGAQTAYSDSRRELEAATAHVHALLDDLADGFKSVGPP